MKEQALTRDEKRLLMTARAVGLEVARRALREVADALLAVQSTDRILNAKPGQILKTMRTEAKRLEVKADGYEAKGKKVRV